MKRAIISAMVLSLAAGSLALADPPQDSQHDRHDQQHHQLQHHQPMHRTAARFNSGRYVRPHGYYAHAWRRGDRLPPAYRGSAYVIANPVIYHLRPAPRGYYWVRVDNNAVLAAVTTGAVLSVSVNLFH